MLLKALGNVSPLNIVGTLVQEANYFIAISQPYSDRKERNPS